MFLIKEININMLEDTVKIIHGLTTYKINNKYEVKNCFWGKSEVFVGKFIDELLIRKNDGKHIISYANEIVIKNLDDNYKQIDFNISAPDKNNINGYIIIIKYGENIKTDGSVLFRRYPTEIVAMLKEGNYLEVYNKRFEVINNKLCMIL